VVVVVAVALGTVVGGTKTLVVDVVGVVVVVVLVPDVLLVVDVVVGGAVVEVVLVVLDDVLVDVLVDVDEAPGGVELMILLAPARYMTSTTDVTPEPSRRVWVRRRARANRRSRCWGVLVEGVMRGPSHPPVSSPFLNFVQRASKKTPRKLVKSGISATPRAKW
jgi:hypothetical protein